MNGQENDMASKDDESRFFSRLKFGLKKTRDSLAIVDPISRLVVLVPTFH